MELKSLTLKGYNTSSLIDFKFIDKLEDYTLSFVAVSAVEGTEKTVYSSAGLGYSESPQNLLQNLLDNKVIGYKTFSIYVSDTISSIRFGAYDASILGTNKLKLIKSIGKQWLF